MTVDAGENPAHRIIDSLMAHRKANNPNSLESYRYNIYDQMVITIDSSDFGKAIADDLIAILVVALFYGGDINMPCIGFSLLLIVFVVWLNITGEKRPWFYFIPV